MMPCATSLLACAMALASGENDASWRPMDGVVVIVNSDIITRSQLETDLRRAAREGRINTETERRAAELQLLRERLRERLRVQGGHNLGLPEEQINALVKDNLERLREREQGVMGLSRFLQSRDVSPQEAPRLLRDDILGQTWQSSVTGEGLGPLGRRFADTWVRPGKLPQLYEGALRRPADLSAIGGLPARAKLQQIVLDPEKSGGDEVALALLRSLRERVLAGEDLGPLVREHSLVRDEDGIGEVELSRLRELFPELHEFAARAAPGDLSAPIESRSQGQRLFRLVRLLERSEEQRPELRDPTVQRKLLARAKEREETSRLERAYADLMRSSYAWPPELAERPEK
jgi:parvulin-like peptidyl-prolyl isomerase